MKGILGCALFLSTIAVASAATTGSVVLSGSIPANTSIAVTPTGSYNNLDLTTAANDLLVANVLEKNNTANGYTVTISSLNAGKLKNGTLGQITYTAKYNGTNAPLNGTPSSITTQGAQTVPINTSKQLTISYPAQDPNTLMQGSYTDTLTFTITAN